MNNRRKSRELALQVLFQDEFQLGIDYEASLATYKEAFETEMETYDYAAFLLYGIKKHADNLDEKISASSSHWKIERMALIDRNILRLGAFELVHCAEDVPPQVAINESIELAKKYGSNESKGFVNGILDQILKSI